MAMFARIVIFHSLIISLFFLLFLTVKPVFANYLGNGLCDEVGGPGPYDVPLQDCQDYGGILPQNVCFQVPWTFRYAAGCTAYADTSDPNDFRCDPNGWSYQYEYNSCNTEDRCWGSNTGASGFDSAGRVIPGICSASSYNGSDPNSACISGGHYKQCCSNPDPGYTPATYCSSGVCPAGYKTAPLDITCDTPVTCTEGAHYNQCGQTGGCTNNYAGNRTIEITPNNCSDGSTTYSCSDLGVFAGQCGNPDPTPTPTPSPLPFLN